MARRTARQRNVGVFIDAENLFKGYGKLDIPDVSMADLLELVQHEAGEEAGAGGIAVARAYADWARPELKEYQREVERDGVRTVQVFSVGKEEKNAADIELVVDCLRYAADLESLEVFVLVSGDGDFVPLVRRLHELGKFVVGATLEQHKVNGVLEREADLFVSIPAQPAMPAEKPAEKPAKKAAKKPAAKKAQPQKKSEPEKGTPKKSGGPPNWHDLAQKIGTVRTEPAGSPEDYKQAVKELLETPAFHSYCDKLVAHGGTLPMLSMALRAAAPELKPSAVGVRNLSRALRFALAGTRYALAQGPDDAQPRLVRRRSKAADMLPDLTLEQVRTGSA